MTRRSPVIRRSPLARRRRDAGDRLVAQALVGITGLVGMLPIDRALDVAHGIGVRLGPRAARHRIVLNNLRLAFPDMAEAERRRIGAQMWGHQARLIVETAHAGRLFDFDPSRDPFGTTGRVEMRNALDLDERLALSRPTIFFTGHTGCFEFLPAVTRAYGYPMATLFRAPNNRYIARHLLTSRQHGGGVFVRAGRGAAATLTGELAAGRGVGVLVDQKFRGGLDVPFLGVPAPTNRLVARLAERTGGEVVPARCVRLPGNRYRVDIERPMTLPRTAAGEIDAPAGLAAINAKVEGWVREYPEQWMWFHRRWG